jgi:hypothetical protein
LECGGRAAVFGSFNRSNPVRWEPGSGAPQAPVGRTPGTCKIEICSIADNYSRRLPLFALGCQPRRARRYFKEDGLTEAMYISLVSNESYTVTTPEHTGVWVEQSGSWSKLGSRITFSPKKPGSSPHIAEEVTYKKPTFLSLKDDSGPSTPIPVEEIERDIDKERKALPPYVFFEVGATVFNRRRRCRIVSRRCYVRIHSVQPERQPLPGQLVCLAACYMAKYS